MKLKTLFLFFIINFITLQLSSQVISPFIRNLTVSCLAQDSLGFMWIGTSRGLYKYNGYEYKCYMGNPSDPNNVMGDGIFKVLVDDNGDLWVITTKGILKYNYQNDQFLKIHPFKSKNVLSLHNLLIFEFKNTVFILNKETNALSISSHLKDYNISTLYYHNDKIWVGCHKGNQAYIYVLNSDFTDVLKIYPAPKIPNSFCFLSDTCLLAGAKNGVFLFDLNTGEEKKVLDNNQYEFLNQLQITFISRFLDDILLIGTANKGLIVFNLKTTQFMHINQYLNGANVTSKHITTSLIDNYGNLWLGTFDKGCLVINQNKILFNKDKDLHDAFYGRFVTCFLEHNKDLWIGTRSFGLAKYNKLNKKICFFTKHNSSLFDKANNNFVQTLFSDSKGRIWISTDSHLSVCDISSSKLKVLHEYDLIPVTISEDALGQVWLGTGHNGLIRIGEDLKAVNILSNENITKIIPYDTTRMLYASYGKGLYLIDIKSGTNEALVLPDNSIPQKRAVIEIYKDSDDVLWFGTYSGGLISFNRKNNVQRIYTLDNGLPSNDVLAIQDDGDRGIWFSTSWGLSRMDKKTGHIRNFFDFNGTYGNQFHEKSSLKSKDGILYFSGTHGLTFFRPSEVVESRVSHPVMITGMKVLNKEIQVNDISKILRENILYTDSIVLSHNQNSFSFDYAAINFDHPQKIFYSYKLEGHDKVWNYVDNLRKASYSNVPSGHYQFKVRAQNDDGTWDDEHTTVMNIDILRSPWLSYWAIFIYFTLSLAIGFVLLRLYVHYRLSDERLKLLEYEKQHDHEVMQMKFNFLGNISHEIRTPLTLIYGCIHLLNHNKVDSEREKLTKLINYNMQRLLRLLNQMIEYSKNDKETLPLHVSVTDVVNLVNNLLASYEYYVKEKNITLTFVPHLSDNHISADPDKLDKILNNLVSNAVKYTPNNGAIIVEINESHEKYAGFILEDSDRYIKFTVKDTGVGITSNELPHLFDRFARFKDKDNQNKTSIDGFGIGLHYVKKLVDLQHGDIKAMKNEPCGTIFSFVIPELFETEDSGEGIDTMHVETLQSDEQHEAELDSHSDTDARQECSILIVDDNVEVHFLLSKLLKERHFDVYTANNGKEGLEKAREIIPDIILSDVIMPQMDGFEFCREVKRDEQLSHIPVVLLTAKVSKDDYVSGYESGASIFVEKPFYPEVLLAQIENILKTRAILHQKVQNQNYEQIEEKGMEEGPTLTDIDKKFLDKLYDYMEKELDNEYLSVDEMSKSLGFSRTSFYRKMVNLVGQPPLDFIREYRLKKAAELICSSGLSMGEISIKTGFGTYSNFSVRFKKMYGVSPKDYKEAQVKKN